MALLVTDKQNIIAITRNSHPVFKYVEKRFDDWIKSSNPVHEYREQYFGDEAVLSKTGAIRQAIENAMDEAMETGKPVDLEKFDLETAFE